jgi:hypothetical protein
VQVCGAGFYKIDKHRLCSGSRHTTLLAATFLLYNGSTGQRGKRRPWVVDQAAYKYYAGPVYRKGAGHCVRWGADGQHAVRRRHVHQPVRPLPLRERRATPRGAPVTRPPGATP